MCRLRVAVLCALAAAPLSEGSVFKVAMLLEGAPTDYTWNFRHNQGRLNMIENLLNEFSNLSIVSEIASVPSVNVPEVEAQLQLWGNDSYDLVLTTSFQFQEPTIAAAVAFPATNWVHISGFMSGPPNFVVGWCRVYQTRYLTGLVAGGSSSSKKLGYVAAFRGIAEVVRGINAFAMGARSVCSDCVVYTTFVNAWHHVKKVGFGTNWMIDLGCDVIANHVDDRTVYDVAINRSIMMIGYHNDMRSVYGDGISVSAYFTWGNMYTEFARDTILGRFRDAEYTKVSYGAFPGMESGVPAISLLSQSVRRDVRTRVEEKRSLFTRGEADVFCSSPGAEVYETAADHSAARGPLRYGSNSTHPVQCASVWELLGMQWLVDGVLNTGDVVLPEDACPQGTRYVFHKTEVPAKYTCWECEPGTFSSSSGSAACEACQPGSVSGHKMGTCMRCPQGQYAPAAGMSACLPCPSRRTNLGEGNTDCPVHQADLGWTLYAILIPACFAGLLLMVAPFVAWRWTAKSRHLRRLYNDNAVAEAVAESIAAMRLEEVEYIMAIPKPNRIQRSFITIVELLKEYRRYLPASLLAVAGGENVSDTDTELDDDELTSVDVIDAPKGGECWADRADAGKEGIKDRATPPTPDANSVSPPGLSPSVKKGRPRRPTLRSLGSSIISGASGSECPSPRSAVRRKEELRTRLAAQLDVGCRLRKTAVLLAAVDVDGKHPLDGFETSSVFVQQVLQCVDAADGMPLRLCGDSVVSTWNAHKPCPRYAFHCCVATDKIRQLMSSEPARDGTWWSVCSAAGQTSTGHVGDSKQRAPFVLGRPVVHVSALASLGTRLNSSCLVTQSIQELCQARYEFVPVDIIPLDPTVEKADSPPQQMLVFEMRGEVRGEPDLRVRHALGAAWSQLRQRNPNFDAVAERADELLRIRPGDWQFYRLRQLAAAGQRDPGGLPNPYMRKMAGWVDHEMIARDESCVLDSGTTRDLRARPESSMSTVLLPSSPTQDKRVDLSVSGVPSSSALVNADYLRAEIEKARDTRDTSRRSSSSSGSSLGDRAVSGSSAERAADGEFPGVFTDRGGSRWWKGSKRLGAGGFGEVWLGMGEDGGLVALKMLPLPQQQQQRSRLRPRSEQTADRLDELLAEVRLMSDLQHDNVVAVLSSAVVQKWVVVVMEFVPGGSLQTVLEQFGALPDPSLKRYTRDVLRGLHFLHSRAVIHRDLKPANLLLEIDGQCKLADFGAAAELSAVAQQRTLGTPLYMAPEAARGAAATASDIWSFGITLFQLTTGRMPWTQSVSLGDDGSAGISSGSGQSTSIVQWMRKLAKDEGMVPDVSTVSDPDLLDFIRSTLKRDPSLRPTVEGLLLHTFLH
eukprot:TRINITY_DN3032_c0_g2_i1.p1 TRINITY_DN3032_c0_g2~~TRINITY_DN3032_c0_g2_i1.p1  ORF type:complete len:1361 (+),score=411.78 TRINITY_DN3032_c0_g2_i1:58-4140(+)